jgi:LysR family hydrogen peroxide-inducible transcriptional activator
MNIIDKEGGITLIPQLAREGMSPRRLANVKSFTNFKPLREVSLSYSRHFAKHKLINLLWREIREDIPVELQDDKRGTIVEWK